MQKHSLLIYLILQTVPLCAQFNENFADGELLSNPTWIGDINSFMVNASQSLQLSEDGAGSAFLVTSSKTISESRWEFRVSMDFNPSTNNFCRIYLASDISAIKGEVKGYYVQIGGAEDEVSLYRQTDAQRLKIINGLDGFLDFSFIDLEIIVTRSQQGSWRLMTRLNGQTTFSEQGNVIDASHVDANFFGIYCQFTSSRSDKFFFDDVLVQGPSRTDIDPPRLKSVTVLDDHRLQLIFSEPMGPLTIANFKVALLGKPLEVVMTSPEVVELVFSWPFQNMIDYQLTAQNLADLAGNTLSFTTLFVYTQTGEALIHDVIISEIMADPTPNISLPDKEYLEIYNRSNKAFNLKGWVISDQSRESSLPEYLLLPGQHLLLCPESRIQTLDDSIDAIGISPWPTLNNASDLISIFNAQKEVIHFVGYTDSWYRSELKRHGGWSLEIIDPNYPCSGAPNWTASISPSGGTPASMNSVAADNPDFTGPKINSTYAPDPGQFQITFDQPLSPVNSASAKVYLEPPLALDTFFLPTLSEPLLSIRLRDSLEENQIYEVTIRGIADCNGNVVTADQPVALLGLEQNPDSLDVIINELLFNPRPLGVRFVELYNRSNKAFNLRNWNFARWQGDLLMDITSLSTHDLMIYPGAHYVFTESPHLLKNQYPKSAEAVMVEVSDLPTLGDKHGSIILISKTGRIIDSFVYSSDLHHPLLTDLNGVSLERVSADHGTNNPGNWYSASENAGYATPGRSNSQSIHLLPSRSVSIDSRVISPLSNTLPGYARITYNFTNPGNSGTIVIFDSQGNQVKRLLDNSSLGSGGIYQWDGTNDQQSRVPMGYYIVHFQIVNPSGAIANFKETVVVAPRF